MTEQRARPAGRWTIQKLNFLKDYLRAYIIATRSYAGDRCYVDLFCGPGLDRSRETGEVIDGSPRIAMTLNPGFDRFIFVDLDNESVRQVNEFAISRRLAGATSTFTGDCNQVVRQVREAIPRNSLAFCFVDPAGTDANWDTIRTLSLHRAWNGNKAELLILFPYDMALVRFLARDPDSEFMTEMDSEARVDSVMPGAWWRSTYTERNAREIGASEARRRFAYMYWMGLKELGYRHVPSPFLMKTSPTGRPLYFLFFASDHPAGGRIISHIFDSARDQETQVAQPQLGLPFAESEFSVLLPDSIWDFDEGELWYAAAKQTEH